MRSMLCYSARRCPLSLWLAGLLVFVVLFGCEETVRFDDISDLPSDANITRDVTRELVIEPVDIQGRPHVCSLKLAIHSVLVATERKDGQIVDQQTMENRVAPKDGLQSLLCNDQPMPEEAYVTATEYGDYLLTIRLAELPLALLDAPKLTLTGSVYMGKGSADEEIVTGSFELDNPCHGDKDLGLIRRRFQGKETSPECYLALAEYYGQTGYVSEKSYYVGKAVDALDGTFREDVWKAKAQAMVAEHQYKSAADQYKDLYDKTHNPEYGILAATHYMDTGRELDVMRARQFLRLTLCDEAPDDWRPWHLLFKADRRIEPDLRAGTDLDEAMLALRRATALYDKPEEFASEMSALELTLNIGYSLGYVDIYEDQLERLKSDPAAYNRLIEEVNPLVEGQNEVSDLLQAQQWRQAMEKCRELRRKKWTGVIDFAEAVCWNNLGVDKAEAEQWVEAAECFEQAFELDPRDRSNETDPNGEPLVIPNRTNAALANWRAGEVHPIGSAERLRYWRKAAKYAPENGTYVYGTEDGMTLFEALAQASESISKAWEAQAEYNKAVKELEQALADVNVLVGGAGQETALQGDLREGETFLAAKEYDKAIEFFTTALAEHPVAEVHQKLAQAYAAGRSDLDAAETHLDQALDLYEKGTHGDLLEKERQVRMAECHHLRALVLEMRLDRLMQSDQPDDATATRYLQGAMIAARKAMQLDRQNRVYRDCFARLRQSRDKITLLLDPDARRQAEEKEKQSVESVDARLE